MPKYKSPVVAVPLPQRTLDYLEHGAPEGTRNAELFDATCQFRDAGQSVADAESRLLARAVSDGLSETEARQTIRSAFNGAAREPLATKPEGHDTRQPPRHGTVPPEPIEGGILQILADCFHPDEFVSIAPAHEDEMGEIAPRSGVTLTAAAWIAKVETKGGIEKVFGTKLGLFMRINPMIKDGTKNADVTKFRHALVEFDCDTTGNRIPKAEQYRRITESGMPVAALIDSGNKSLHAWISVDAPNEAEYKRRVAIVWKYFEAMNLDRQNRNPSRLSRCPDGQRTVDGEVRRQRLLATRLGAESWDAWESGNKGVGEPPFVDLAEIIANGCEMERPTVADVGLDNCLFYAGRINEIHAEPGVGKSNVAIAASLAVMRAGGLVVFIDPEDNPGGFTRRCLQFGATREDLIECCRYLHNPTPDDIILTQRWAAKHRPTLVVFDGLAESLTAEDLVEDKVNDVLKFFRSRLRPFADDSGAAVLVSDHVAKSLEGRGRWPRGSGAKLGRYDGVVYLLDLVDAYSPGQKGAVSLTIAKDRNGGIGPNGITVAEVQFSPGAGNQTTVIFKKPEESSTVARPIRTIFRIRKYLEEHGQADKRTLRTLGKSETIDSTVDFMIAEGSLILTVEGRKHVYTLPVTANYAIGKNKQSPADCVPCP
jgi:hypothetical protein